MKNSAGTAAVEPVRKTVRVHATPARAFEVFTSDMGRWWPATHTVSATKAPVAAVVVEPRAGGRWYEIGTDGSECGWGHVIAWEPPTRLLLAWQLDAEWKYHPTLITEVEVLFESQEPGVTEVKLEHRKLERFGDAAEAVRTSIGSPGGWSALMDAYAEAVA